MNQKNLFFAVIIALVFGVTGCTPAISKAFRSTVSEGLTFQMVKADPVDYIGKTVVWGGVIIETTNVKEGTKIEVLQKPLDFELRPKSGDVTYGRFLAFYEGYLDSAIYANGREITIGGTISGQEIALIDEIQYTYPLISIAEIHLWQEINNRNEPYYYPYHWYWRHHPY